MIKIICLGNIKETYLKEALQEYQKRISKYTKLEIIELRDEKDNIVILDIKGKEYTSEEFATFINKELTLNSNITFIIGSSHGLDEEIKKLTNKKISFSHLTFPHQLFRVILLEQIYRAFKILNNETYHK